MRSKLQQYFRKFIFPFFTGIVVGMFLISLFENHMIYYPIKYPEGNWQPEQFGIKAEDCYFTTADNIRLHGWFISAPKSRTTLLWFHGNAGNVTHRIDLIQKLQSLNINIFIIDYRGYGRSDGSPSEEGLYEDAKSAFDYLTTRSDVNSKNIIVFGQSLGSAVAVDLAIQRPVRALILEASFSSAVDVAKTILPWLPIHLFIRSNFNSERKIKFISIPILFIHGTKDDTIPIQFGKKLYEAANKPKWFYEIPDAEHNDTYLIAGEDYLTKLDEFITYTENNIQ